MYAGTTQLRTPIVTGATVNESSSAVLLCRADPNATLPLEFRWYKGGVELPTRTAALEILLASRYDAGEYTCVTSNGDGSSNATASLIVHCESSRYNNSYIYRL